MKIIDAHNHPDWHGHDLKNFIANMDKYGIEKCWLLSWEAPADECAPGYVAVTPGGICGSKVLIPFQNCINYKNAFPERFILGYAPDPRDPAACKKLKAAHSIYGAKLCGEVKFRMMYDSPDALRLFRTAGELGMPVTLHFDYDFQKSDLDPWTEWYGGTIDTLERMLQACPETVFLGHAPGFWIHISNDEIYKERRSAPAGTPVVPGGKVVELMRKYPNLYCDISANSGCNALRRDPEHAVRFLTEFQDRILYARDYFDNQHQEFLNSLELPEAILQKIYSLNAIKLAGE